MAFHRQVKGALRTVKSEGTKYCVLHRFYFKGDSCPQCTAGVPPVAADSVPPREKTGTNV